MAADSCEGTKKPAQLDEFPEVNLDWVYDETDNPSRLTLFDPSTRRLATAWITVDSDVRISLERAR